MGRISRRDMQSTKMVIGFSFRLSRIGTLCVWSRWKNSFHIEHPIMISKHITLVIRKAKKER
jgi:hypothetical protein